MFDPLAADNRNCWMMDSMDPIEMGLELVVSMVVSSC